MPIYTSNQHAEALIKRIYKGQESIQTDSSGHILQDSIPGSFFKLEILGTPLTTDEEIFFYCAELYRYFNKTTPMQIEKFNKTSNIQQKGSIEKEISITLTKFEENLQMLYSVVIVNFYYLRKMHTLAITYETVAKDKKVAEHHRKELRNFLNNLSFNFS